MQISPSMQISFSSLALVNNPFDWAYGLEELGFTGWEVVSEGKQQLNDNTLFRNKKYYRNNGSCSYAPSSILRP